MVFHNSSMDLRETNMIPFMDLNKSIDTAPSSIYGIKKKTINVYP